MIKYLFILLCLLSVTAIAMSQEEAIRAKDKALQALGQFNPGSVLKGYTDKPSESYLQPEEGTNNLAAQGLNALKNNQAANEVYKQAGSRPKVHPNPNTWPMRYAEALLENPEQALDGKCYKVPGECTNQSSTKQCKESVEYNKATCQETLEVQVQTKTQEIFRAPFFQHPQSQMSFDLQTCSSFEAHCTSLNIIVIPPSCEHLVVSVLANNRPVQVIKQPTCSDTRVTIPFHRFFAFLHIKVTQYESINHWKGKDCEALKEKTSKGQCLLEESDVCLEPNKTKMIDNIPIKRPCWGRSDVYQCAVVNKSDCKALIQQGCRQTASECIEVRDNRCHQYSQIFQCSEEICKPEEIVCPGKMACTDGQCDRSKSEISDDMAEGVSRLGALAESANTVATQQINSGMPNIFAGNNSTCRKVYKGIRNCCKGSSQMRHCSEDEKKLAKAKEEGRAFYVGTYCVKKVLSCLEEKESWCVFPTKLAAIIQIQGRLGQLGINFGWADDEDNKPNCGGITPEQLQCIDFSRLNLSPVAQELVARMKQPDDAQINKNNQAHIERLKEKGHPYD